MAFKSVAVLLLLYSFSCISSGQILNNPGLDLIAKARERAASLGYTEKHFREFDHEPFGSKLVEQMVPGFIRELVNKPESELKQTMDRVLAKVSGNCGSVLLEGAAKLKAGNPDMWYLHMIDAWGKLPSGILSGNLASPGDFTECLEMRGSGSAVGGSSVEFKGLYCSAYVVPMIQAPAALNKSSVSSPNPRLSVGPEQLLFYMNRNDGVPMYPFLGSCFPSVCTSEDAVEILKAGAAEISSILAVIPLGCRTDEKEPLTTGAYTMIVVLAIITGCCVVGTLVDILVIRRRSPDAGRPSKVMQAVKAFSWYDNFEKILGTEAGKDNLGCLHGLRFLSMAFVVCGHTWLMLRLQFTWNGIDSKTMDRIGWTMTIMLNPTISVDTFFCMSGLLVAYNVLRELDKTRDFKQFAMLKVPLMYFHRYVRLTPTYAILVGVLATLFPYFNSSPLWHMMELEAENCKRYWWHNILYFNNLLDYRKLRDGPDDSTNMCYQESWYLANDMQFFILSPLLIYPLYKSAKLGLALLGLFSAAHIAGNFAIFATHETTATVLPLTPEPEYAILFYWRPWTRIGPYLVGIFVGWLLYHQKKKDSPYAFTIPKWAVWFGWTLNTAVSLAIVFGANEMIHPENTELIFHSVNKVFYGALHRYVWSMCVGWMIFACVTGNGGIVNRILSWSPFIPLGRLTYCVYISSFHIQLMYHLTLMHPAHFTNYIMMHNFFAHLVFCCMIGLILTITIESPFMRLQKLLMG